MKVTANRRRLQFFVFIISLLLVLFQVNIYRPRIMNKNSKNSNCAPGNRIFPATTRFEKSNRTTGKRIFLATTLLENSSWNMITGTFGYEPYTCSPGYQCQLTDDSSAADALLFSPFDMKSVQPVIHSTRTTAQRWIFFCWEPHKYVWPLNEFWRGKFNWTATYMRESDIVVPYCLPYRKLKSVEKKSASTIELYDVSSKTRFAFAVISNCNATRRWKFIESLRRYIDVDIYGKCGQPLGKDVGAIVNVSHPYRYYLSFENSLCKDYITEKFFDNALRSFAVPVVYGGLSRNDYDHVAPPHSFIYAPDFQNTSLLAKFLITLSKRESDYARYFEWKRRFIFEGCSMGHYFVCEICRRLHTDTTPSIIDINDRFSMKKHCFPEEMKVN